MSQPNTPNYNIIRYEFTSDTPVHVWFKSISRKYTKESIFDFLIQLDDDQLRNIGIKKEMHTYTRTNGVFRFPRFIDTHRELIIIGQFMNLSDEIVIINNFEPGRIT